ncbi:MAG: hypothetical protein ACYDHD_05750 [Vulcanimicrobiaceae bacterium]
MRKGPLPLSIDLGRTRLRVCSALQGPHGVCIGAVATRRLPDGVVERRGREDACLVAAILEEAVAELGVRERRCVAVGGAPESVLHMMEFPPMTPFERRQAASLEAARWHRGTADMHLRLHPLDAERRRYALGIISAGVLEWRLRVLREAGLRPLAYDDESFALRRAFPGVDAVLDVASGYSRLHVYPSHGVMTFCESIGGESVTLAIAAALTIDRSTAERRKRILGAAGGGESGRSELVRRLGELITLARGQGLQVERVALAGNGGRLDGIAQDLSFAAQVSASFVIPVGLDAGAYPESVLRRLAPDWATVVGLASWSSVP